MAFCKTISRHNYGSNCLFNPAVGIITIQTNDSVTNYLGNREIMWLIAFLAGFSDRFADTLLRTVVGKFGGQTDGDLLTIQMTSQTTRTDSTTDPLDYLQDLSQSNRNGTQTKIGKEQKSINNTEIIVSNVENGKNS